MSLYMIAYKSLWQRKGKSMFLMIGLVLSLVTVITLMGITQFLEDSIDRSLKEHGATMMVIPATEQVRVSFGGITVVDDQIQQLTYLDDESIRKLETLLNDSGSILIEKTVDLGTVNGQETMLVFTDLGLEMQANPSWGIVEGQDRSAFIGHDLYQMGMTEEQKFTAIYQGNIFNSDSFIVLPAQGNENDQLVLIDRKQFSEKFLVDFQTNVIQLYLPFSSMEQINQIKATVEKDLPELQVRADLGNLEARQSLFEEFKTYTTFTIVTIIAVGLFLITATMMGSVNERTREFGIVRTIGYRKRHIASVIIWEAVVLFTISLIVAIVLGVAVTNLVLMSMYAGEYQLFVPAMAIVYIGIGGMLISIGASLYPALKAANLDPIDAVKAV